MEATEEKGNGQDKALVPTDNGFSPLDLPPEEFRAMLDRREANRKELVKWVKANLVEGEDYGRIWIKKRQQWSKYSLRKPGAEKICGMLGLAVRFPNADKYEQAVAGGAAIRQVIIKCQLLTASGYVAAEGVGARLVAQDEGDLNKSIKMAEKSAHINATLRVSGLSEMFTQDLLTDEQKERIAALSAHSAVHDKERARALARIEDDVTTETVGAMCINYLIRVIRERTGQRVDVNRIVAEYRQRRGGNPTSTGNHHGQASPNPGTGPTFKRLADTALNPEEIEPFAAFVAATAEQYDLSEEAFEAQVVAENQFLELVNAFRQEQN